MAEIPPKDWMWARACEMIDRADRLQRRFFAPAPSGGTTPAWEAPADVFEDAGRLRVVVALPGVTPDSIEVHAEPDALMIVGRRRLPSGMSVRRLEIPYGWFGRRVALPLGRFVVGGSRFENGCLEVDLWKLQRGFESP